MMKRMGGFGSKRLKKGRKGKKGKQAKGRVTPKGKPSLKLPNFDPDALPSLDDLQGGGADRPRRPAAAAPLTCLR